MAVGVKSNRIIWASLLISGGLCALLYGWSRSNTGAAGVAPSPVILFAADSFSSEGDFSERDISKQHKFVHVHSSAMENLAQGADQLRLQLLDGKEYTVMVTGRNDNPVASVATGELKEAPGSEVILSTASGSGGVRKITGTFTMPDGKVFQLVPTMQGHCLFELDQENVDINCGPAESGGIAGTYRANGETIQIARQSTTRRLIRGRRLFGGSRSSNGGGSSGSSGGSSGSSGGSSSSGGNAKATIDVVVLYTPPAEKAKGGEAGIKSLIGSAVESVNSSFSKSKINATIKLVGTGKMNYDSKGNLSAAMTKLRKDQTANSLRDSKKADLISLMVSGDSRGSAGLGSLMPSAKGNKGACYTVVHQKYATSYSSFAHEVGHNLGSNHCWDQSGKGVFDYSHGHRWKGSDGKGYRSIMSYAKDGDSRTTYFSNPQVKYKDKATGDASKADNAKGFGKTVPVAAKYK